MAKKKSTDLKLTDVLKKSKSLQETAQYELEDGYTITFTPLFGDLQIETMIEELQQHYKTMKDKGIDLSEKMKLYFINLLMIKTFTHFSKDMPNELLAVDGKEMLLDWLSYFADTGLMKTIMDEVFMKDQVMKVYDKLAEFIGTSMLLDELGTMTQNHLANLRNKYSGEINKLENTIVQ